MKLFSGGSKTVWVQHGREQLPRQRAGWIRRGVAVAIDSLLVMLVLMLVGVPAFVLTNGRLQSGGLPSADCVAFAAMPDEISPPPGIKVKAIETCRTTVFSIVVGNELSVQLDTVDAMKLETGLTWPLNRDGVVVSGILLPVLFIPVLALWRAYGDSRGRPTLGRVLTRIEVITLRSERPSLRLGLVRQALNWSVLALVIPPFLWVQLTASFPSAVAWIMIATWAVAMIVLVPWIIGTIGMLQSDRDTLIDRWLRTTVVRRT